MNYTIIEGDNRETLKTIPSDSVDSIITDPPYGIDFLGKSWDANTGALETYQECFRVLKPGGYILAFSAARTYHHLAITLEQAGFEIKDQIMWIYSSGFPKAQDIGKAIDKRKGKTDPNYGSTNNNGTAGGINLSFTEDAKGGGRRCNRCDKDTAYRYECKDEECGLVYNYQSEEGKQWAGWKTALKPAHEPICMARKPFKGSTIDNVLEHGVGALNIDDTRVLYENESDLKHQEDIRRGQDNSLNGRVYFGSTKSKIEDITLQGRFPSNVIGEIEGYQKYFYCPKVSRKERHIGFVMPEPLFGQHKGAYDENGQRYAVELDKRTENVGNNHPTVKPVELMKYLIKLVTPPNSTVLDPFTGSGSTGMAAIELGHTFIGCELDPHYAEIARRRIRVWNKHEPMDTIFEALFE